MAALALLITDLHLAPARALAERAAAIARDHLAHARAHHERRPGRGDELALVFGVRDHDAPAGVRLDLARRLIAVVREHGARVVVHDRVDVALAAGADGVWLGERSILATDARRLLSEGAFVGRSCHDDTGLAEACAERVDAVTLSPVLASPGKGAPLGIAGFAALRARHPALSVLALGGVDAASLPSIRAAGAAGFAAIRAWLRPDGVAVVREMVGSFAVA